MLQGRGLRTARCDWWATAKQANEEQLSPIGQSSGRRWLAQCWGADCADKPQCKEGGVTSGRQNVFFALFSVVALFYNCVERFPSLNVCSEVQRRLLCSSNPAGQPGLGAGWGLNCCLLCVGTGWALSVKVVCPALLGPAPVTSSVAWSIYALWAVIWCPFWISHMALFAPRCFICTVRCWIARIVQQHCEKAPLWRWGSEGIGRLHCSCLEPQVVSVLEFVFVEVRVRVTSGKKEGEEAFVVLQRKQILGFLLLARERSV